MGWSNQKACQALEDQLELIRFWRSDRGRIFGDGFREDEGTKTGMLRGLKDGEMAARAADTLDRAETVWISPDMHDLILGVSASEGLPTTLEDHDLLFPRGFMVLPSPIFLQDVHDLTVSVGAIAWSQEMITFQPGDDGAGMTAPGLLLYLYSVPNDIRDESAQPIRDDANAHGWSIPKHMLLTLFAAPLNEPLPIVTIHQPKTGEPSGKPITDHDPARYFLATMLLSQQKLAGISGIRPYRALAKRSMRSRSRADIPDIAMIDLRRHRMPEAHEESDTDEAPLWSHRWVVNGHWRRQWFPSEGVHRWRYIAPHVKGPDHLPLIVKDRIYRLVR